MGDGVGEQADAAFVRDAGAENGGQFRRPDGGKRVVGKLDYVEVGSFWRAEVIGEEVVFPGRGLGKLVGAGLVSDGQINLHIAGAGR